MNDSTFIKIAHLPAGQRGAIAAVTVEKVGGREAPIVQEELIAAAAAAKWRLGVDLSGVTLLSSIGLGALVAIHKQCREQGGLLVVCGLGKELQDILKLTHLDRILRIVKDCDAATKAIA